jgi:hydroxypyruvate isomerase
VSGLRWSANLSFLFGEVPFLERFAQAAAAGFDAVEFMWPADFAAREIRAAQRDAGLSVALFNVAGDMAADAAPFREAAISALELAAVLECPRVNALAGSRPAGADDVLTNARWLAERAGAVCVEVDVEPLNPHDNPGYLLPTAASVVEFLRAADRPGLRLQYDTFHALSVGADVVQDVRAYFADIGHVQLGDHPGRTEPGTGALAVAPFLDALTDLGYRGYVGAEYHPRTTTQESLGWFESARCA